ncbi:MAG: acetylornithine deacetylase [Hyphomicrobiales bacterium]
MFPSTSEDILAALIAFDTTSRDSNIPLIAWVERFLDHHEVPHFRVDYEPGKTNLFATIGPDVEGGIVLSGHTDVVPVDGQAWSSDPFTLRAADGLLFGRGTADMKGFIAVCLAMVPAFKARALKVPIHFAFSCDEEVGCRGVVPLVEHMRDFLKRPAAVIVGEPTSMQVVNAHKSATRFSTEVTGHESHSALTDRGVNAIMVAAELISEISRVREDFIAAGDPTGRFDPPYSTVHVGVIKGGTANNIVPRSCAFSWEMRLLPGADKSFAPARVEAVARRLEPAMKAVSPLAGVALSKATDVPGLAPETDSPAEILALHCAHANSTHTVSYCTEAGHFQSIGIPAVVCGPGSIEQAHKPDEFIAVEQLRKCEAFMARLAAKCC